MIETAKVKAAIWWGGQGIRYTHGYEQVRFDSIWKAKQRLQSGVVEGGYRTGS
jgi:hypothetical protein